MLLNSGSLEPWNVHLLPVGEDPWGQQEFSL